MGDSNKTSEYIDKRVFDYIASASKEELARSRDELKKELASGLLVGANYEKELELINSRLS